MDMPPASVLSGTVEATLSAPPEATASVLTALLAWLVPPLARAHASWVTQTHDRRTSGMNSHLCERTRAANMHTPGRATSLMWKRKRGFRSGGVLGVELQ